MKMEDRHPYYRGTVYDLMDKELRSLIKNAKASNYDRMLISALVGIKIERLYNIFDKILDFEITKNSLARN